MHAASAWMLLPCSSPCITESGVLGLFWALLYLTSASICISGDPNLALFCPSLAELHRTSSVCETGFTSALFNVCPCASVLQVMFLLNFPHAAQRRVSAGTSLFIPGQRSNSKEKLECHIRDST